LKPRSKELGPGWVYFREQTDPTLDTECLLLFDDDLDSEDDIPPKARHAGFLVEGLDTETIEDCLLRSQQFGAEDNLLADLESCIYYWRFDTFLPYLGAPKPPPPDVVTKNLDRQFYQSLGHERASTPCRAQNCSRGAIQYSVFCRVHHFENIQKKPCPFND